MRGKPKLAVYWSAACAGCEMALANLHEHILDVANHFDFMFCPCLLDTKKKDIEALADGAIAATLFNGAARTEEHLEMARLLRRKSKLLVAMGVCEDTTSGKGSLRLPRSVVSVTSLGDVVPVDYTIPGCPPESEQLRSVLQILVEAFHQGAPLPPSGAVIGADTSTVCQQCSRKRSDRPSERLTRIWDTVPDPEHCLLDQGFACMGAATRSGCGALCPQANMPCDGCYGIADGVCGQEAKT